MERKKASETEFQCCKIHTGSPILKLSGRKWIPSSGLETDDMHFHNYMEIGYCYDGKGTLTIGEENYHFSGKQFSVVPQNCPHKTASVQGTVSLWEYLFINVEEILHGVYSSERDRGKKEQIIRQVNSRGWLYDVGRSPRMAGKILLAIDIMQREEEFYLEEAKGILVSFLLELAREKCEEKENGKDVWKRELLSNALDYISGHYMDMIRIEELAGLCHISQTHFRRLFSDCMNMGPLEYINTVRIGKACELLKKTDAQVSDVAFRCGFSTISTFNRNFRQITGSSPVEWRKCQENFSQQMPRRRIRSKQGEGQMQIG